MTEMMYHHLTVVLARNNNNIIVAINQHASRNVEVHLSYFNYSRASCFVVLHPAKRPRHIWDLGNLKFPRYYAYILVHELAKFSEPRMKTGIRKRVGELEETDEPTGSRA